MIKMKLLYFTQGGYWNIYNGLYWFFFRKPISAEFIILFLGVGVFYSLDVYFQIIALSKVRASIIQPFHYTLIFWARIFGYFFMKICQISLN